MTTRHGRIHAMRGEGDGLTVYLGDKRGAPFVGLDLRGFNGWTSQPAWMPGGWEFFEPRISTGRLFMSQRGRWASTRVLLPAHIVSFYRWKVRPSGRRYMREHGQQVPQAAVDG
jgi:hypothetical protein